METQSIVLTAIVGSSICVTAEEGDKVFHAISSALRQTDSLVEISFKGVQDLTSLFLNAAIGQLYGGDFDHEVLKNRLRVIDVSQEDLFTLKRCIERAKEYFEDPERFRQASIQEFGESDE